MWGQGETVDPGGIMRGLFRRFRCPLLLLVSLALAVAAYDSCTGIRWSGGYEISAKVERLSDRAVSAALCVVLFRNEWELVDGNIESIDERWQQVSVSDGDSFEVLVRSGGHDSGFGREISYIREEILILRVEYADGGREVIVAELPESRSSREMIVKVP